MSRIPPGMTSNEELAPHRPEVHAAPRSPASGDDVEDAEASEDITSVTGLDSELGGIVDSVRSTAPTEMSDDGPLDETSMAQQLEEMLPVPINSSTGPGPSLAVSLEGDMLADLLEEVPGEPPTMLPASAAVTSLAGHLRDGAQPMSIPPSATFVPLARPSPAGGSSHLSRLEAFLGRPLEPPSLPDLGPPLQIRAAWQLVERRSVETALQLLSRADVPRSPEVDILHLRCLVASRRYQVALEEAVRILSQQGDNTPFEVRMISAQLPSLLNSDAVTTVGQLQELARSLWSASRVGIKASLRDKLHVLRTLSNVALSSGHGGVALKEIKAAIASLGSTDAAARMKLCSLLGRHYATEGNVAAAAEAFSLAHAELSDTSTLVCIDSGLLQVALNDYDKAVEFFTKAAAGAEEAFTQAVAAFTQAMADNAQVEEADRKQAITDAIDVLVSVENNLAVCRLYTRELQKGVEGLENLVRRDPVKFMQSSVIKNLSALYEFCGGDRRGAAQKRAVLRELAAFYRIEDLDPKVFEQPGM